SPRPTPVPYTTLFRSMEQGRIIEDAELKRQIATEKPYARWLAENLLPLEDLAEAPAAHQPDHKTVLLRQQDGFVVRQVRRGGFRSEEHTSELQSPDHL